MKKIKSTEIIENRKKYDKEIKRCGILFVLKT